MKKKNRKMKSLIFFLYQIDFDLGHILSDR